MDHIILELEIMEEYLAVPLPGKVIEIFEDFTGEKMALATITKVYVGTIDDDEVVLSRPAGLISRFFDWLDNLLPPW